MLLCLMRAVAYIRFSSDDQAKGDSVERQSENIEAYASRNNLEITEILKDEGYSASKGEHISRGRFGRFLKQCDKGEFKGFALIVERLDRLSRLGIEETNTLISRPIKAGLVIHVTQDGRVIKDQNDLLTVIMNTIGAFADAEYSKKLSERIGSVTHVAAEPDVRSDRLAHVGVIPIAPSVQFPVAPSDPETLRAALIETTDLLRHAKKPVILAGVELHRFGLTDLAIKFALAYGYS